jgi:hypothetical protein
MIASLLCPPETKAIDKISTEFVKILYKIILYSFKTSGIIDTYPADVVHR